MLIKVSQCVAIAKAQWSESVDQISRMTLSTTCGDQESNGQIRRAMQDDREWGKAIIISRLTSLRRQRSDRVGPRPPALGKRDGRGYGQSMKDEPGIFEQRDLKAEAASNAPAHTDVLAGYYHEHTAVAEWRKTWGTPNRKPFR